MKRDIQLLGEQQAAGEAAAAEATAEAAAAEAAARVWAAEAAARAVAVRVAVGEAWLGSRSGAWEIGRRRRGAARSRRARRGSTCVGGSPPTRCYPIGLSASPADCSHTAAPLCSPSGPCPAKCVFSRPFNARARAKKGSDSLSNKAVLESLVCPIAIGIAHWALGSCSVWFVGSRVLARLLNRKSAHVRLFSSRSLFFSSRHASLEALAAAARGLSNSSRLGSSPREAAVATALSSSEGTMYTSAGWPLFVR
mmetsp:Transcript_38928/g.128897  ORF Transcript_38928/g.128897 Transcript_38928/m.128897 type:complete len:253 (+) Transcript_38928:2-760(+)